MQSSLPPSAMPQDFSRQNLRGRNFKGQNLTGANFSHADIRSANFTNAILKAANLSHAKAGLQRRWAIFLVIFSLLLSAISGLLSVLAGFLVALFFTPIVMKEFTIIPGLVILIVLAAVFIVTIRKGLAAVVVLGAVTVPGSAVVGIALATIVPASTTATIAMTMPVVVAAIVAAAVAVAVIVATAAAVTRAVAATAAVTVTVVVAVIAVATLTAVGVVAAAAAVATPVAAAVVVLGIYIAWRALAGDEKYAFVRKIAVAFAATGGTNFRGADLTDADFNQAILRNTDFRKANLTRTRFYEAQKLILARVGNSILANQAVFNLLISGNGRDKSYTRANLRGANLKGADLTNANLKEADITEATFQGANLDWANLTLTQAISTDFTNARMTGARVEAWNIENSTKLDNVDCRFVYLLEHPKPGTDDRERRPSSGEFKPGEFTKLFEEVLNTVDLIFDKGIDWKAFVAAFKKVQVENEGTELAIQSIENKGDGVVVVRVSVPPDTNKEKIHSEFTQNYQLALEAVEKRYKAQLQAKDKEIEIYREKSVDLKEIIGWLASRPINVNNEAIASSESKSMNESTDQSRKIEIGSVGRDFNASGQAFNLGEMDISGTVTNTINQLPESPEPDQPGIKELLTELQAAIEAETNLSDEDKAEALEQVKALAEAGKNPQ
ncbi:pentapeptide repeat-containing protein [Microseira sp. BLCC-F43]|uniref:pentapeptide repeat-containing protein n=1 Tax=Microseira sp. BLCC-F43 TaxID=3153602 RepID=UPI0035B8BDBF